MQEPAIQEAKSLGYRVVVTDKNPEVPGAALADLFLSEDLRSPKDIIRAIDERGLGPELKGVFTAGTDFSYSVALVAEHFRLPGISPATARKASDKFLMRQTLSAAEIPGPAHIEIRRTWPSENAKVPVEQFVASHSFPLVLKPVDNMGSRGVRRVDSMAELNEALALAFEYSPEGRCILEEFVRGQEYSIDTLFHRNKLVFSAVAVRHIYFPPYFVELGHSFPSGLTLAQEQEIADLMVNCAQAIGLENGPLKGDIFLGPGGPVVGEIAARLSGGYMSGWTLPYAHGVNLTRAALRVAIGQDPDLGSNPPGFPRPCAERAIVSFPGTVTFVEELVDVPSLPGFKNWFSRVAPGQKLRFPRNNVEKAGNLVFSLDDVAATQSRSATAIASILIHLDHRDADTRGELAKPQHSSIPDAYPPGRDLEALEAMNPQSWDSRLWKDARKRLDFHPSTRLERQRRALTKVLRRYGLQAALAAADILEKEPDFERWLEIFETEYASI